MSLKKVYVAFEVEDGVLKPHDHPVFTGEVAYDLSQEQEVQFNEELKAREFISQGEARAALVDYMREHPKEDREEVTSFILLEVESMAIPLTTLRAPKTRTIAKSATRKAAANKKEE